MNSQTARWQGWADALKIGPEAMALVIDPSAPTLESHQAWINEHRHGPALPATEEVLAVCRSAGLSLRQEISGQVTYRGRTYWVPSASGPSGARVYGAGSVTRAW